MVKLWERPGRNEYGASASAESGTVKVLLGGRVTELDALAALRLGSGLLQEVSWLLLQVARKAEAAGKGDGGR
jgi:hypothetical protein